MPLREGDVMSTVQCPRCGHQQSQTLSVCRSCGFQVLAPAQSPPTASAPSALAPSSPESKKPRKRSPKKKTQAPLPDWAVEAKRKEQEAAGRIEEESEHRTRLTKNQMAGLLDIDKARR